VAKLSKAKKFRGFREEAKLFGWYPPDHGSIVVKRIMASEDWRWDREQLAWRYTYPAPPYRRMVGWERGGAMVLGTRNVGHGKTAG
jgi:hypothetical protein